MTKNGNYVDKEIYFQKKRNRQYIPSIQLRNKVFLWLFLDFMFVLITQYFSTHNSYILLGGLLFRSFFIALATNVIWFVLAYLEGNVWHLSTLVSYSFVISQFLLAFSLLFFALRLA